VHYKSQSVIATAGIYLNKFGAQVCGLYSAISTFAVKFGTYKVYLWIDFQDIYRVLRGALDPAKYFSFEWLVKKTQHSVDTQYSCWQLKQSIAVCNQPYSYSNSSVIMGPCYLPPDSASEGYLGCALQIWASSSPDIGNILAFTRAIAWPSWLSYILTWYACPKTHASMSFQYELKLWSGA